MEPLHFPRDPLKANVFLSYLYPDNFPETIGKFWERYWKRPIWGSGMTEGWGQKAVQARREFFGLVLQQLLDAKLDLRRGDLVRMEAFARSDDKDKTVIFDGQHLVDFVFDQDPNDGSPPEQFQVVTEFPIEYWKNLYPRDFNYVRFDHTMFQDQIMKNLVAEAPRSELFNDEIKLTGSFAWTRFYFPTPRFVEEFKAQSAPLYKVLQELTEEYFTEEYFILFIFDTEMSQTPKPEKTAVEKIRIIQEELAKPSLSLRFAAWDVDLAGSAFTDLYEEKYQNRILYLSLV